MKLTSKHSAQLSYCLKLATSVKIWKLCKKHAAQLSFCLKLVTFVKKLNLFKNTVRSCPVARNWLQNNLCNCRFAWTWRLLITSYKLSKTPCTTVQLLEIAVKTLCATVVSLEVRPFINKLKLVQKTVRNCPVHWNWRQKSLRNFRSARNWRLLLKSKTCPKQRA